MACNPQYISGGFGRSAAYTPPDSLFAIAIYVAAPSKFKLCALVYPVRIQRLIRRLCHQLGNVCLPQRQRLNHFGRVVVAIVGAFQRAAPADVV